MNHVKTVCTLGLVGISLFFACGGASAQSTELPEGPGKAVVQQSCTTCHGSELITAQRRSADSWEEVVNRMLANGATLSDDEHKAVVAYLATHVGTVPAEGASASAAGKASAAQPR